MLHVFQHLFVLQIEFILYDVDFWYVKPVVLTITYLKIGRCEEFVTLAKTGVHLKPWRTWISAFAGMTTGSKPMMKMNYEIGTNTFVITE